LLLNFILVATLCFKQVKLYGQVINNPVVEKIWGGFNFVEGPVWVDDLGLLFSDIPENKVYLFDLDSTVTVYQTPSGNSNGLALDANGNLILAQHGPRQIGRLEENGDITALATHYDGKRLNSPNDLAIATDGAIYFTDPPYGLNDQGGTSELGYYGIYKLMPSGKIYLLDKTLNRPNGIALNLDETKLYVNDSEVRKIYIWDITSDTSISNKQLFASMTPTGYADGMKIDSAGYIYSTGPGGVWLYAPDGTFIRTISVPGQTTNCAWGDANRKTLYVTSGNSVYRIRNKPVSPPVSAIQEKFSSINSSSIVSCPNPASAKAIIRFKVKKSGSITLSVLNATGQKVATLIEGKYTPGEYTIDWSTSNIKAGIYYLILSSEGFQEISMCILMD